ncbi:hypothetical protein BB560_001687 [Smittium megazygosporum]|uniref:NUC153 domain-containing protein n=1 Tax=Smittium megazygosporum TaxID=133381 RepID=A0A2T9ZGU6_9FUNG|nr:hypothetical protein BB560_001687 [Smittium megazygosporum]
MDDPTNKEINQTSNSGHFDMKQILKANKGNKKKFKKRKIEEYDGLQESFTMDAQDDRFASVYTSSDFAIDPNSKNFKKTKAMENLLNERRKKYSRK